MKNTILLLVIIAFTLFSCRSNDKEEVETTTVDTFIYKGHTFLKVKVTGYYEWYTILHDPECKKCLDIYD